MVIDGNSMDPLRGRGDTKLQQNKTGNKAQEAPVQSTADHSSSDNGKDTVQLSDSQQLFNAMTNKIADLPDVNTDRVNELKAGIQRGDYKIDADALADKLLELESGFLDV